MIEIIKKKIGLLPTYILGTDKELQGKYFNILLFFSSLFSSISCVFNFLESTNLALNISNLFCSLVIIILYYLSRFKNYHNMWITVITILAFQSLFWFMNAGSIGSVTYIYILALMFFVIIAKRNDQNKILYIFIINISGLYILEYFFGDKIIIPYSDKYNQYSDMVFVFLLVLFWVFFLSRFIKRSYDDEKELVNKQKLIIEDKNKELLSSLSYASDLQKKIISNGSKLNVLFEDSFVLFKPKDIVSGDFFWVKEKGKYAIVVAADCTGHGVPAAFLSILGISLFEEIVTHETEQLNAGAILEKVRNKFIPYLRKDNSFKEQALDGIDLGICIVNYEDYTFQYSGANRPLFMIRNNELPEVPNYTEKERGDTHTLYSFKATKNTIGFNYKEDQFICHTIEFFPKDTFYAFSDGYADQFDSQNRKKFNVRSLKNELISIQNLSLTSQEIHLDNLHKTWKGETPQTDDILLIGLRM